MKKKNILKVTIFTILISLFLTFSFNNNEKIISSKENYEVISLKDINDNYYEISIDKNNNLATIDGQKYIVEDLDEVSNNEVYDYLKDNSYGEVKDQEESITIINPYSLETLIVETEDKTIFDNYDKIEKVEEISNDLYKVEYKNASDTKEGFEELKKEEKIETVLTDLKVKAHETSVDNRIYSWGRTSTGLEFYKNKLETEDNNVTIKVAVFDTGIRATHEMFKNEVVGDRIDYDGAYDYVNSDTDPTDDNDHGFYEDDNGVSHQIIEYGHGTMVSGIIAQSTSSNVKIVPVKVLDETGSGSFSDILRGIYDVKDKVNIINLSLGSSEAYTVFDSYLKDIYENTDIIIVASTGNDASSVLYPASSAYTLAISSVDYKNNFSSRFSNYGPEVDFAAPGEDLALPTLDGDTFYINGKNGTSFSAPFASAAIALVKADHPDFTRDEVVEYLKKNVIDLGYSGKDNYYGWGSISFHTFIDDIKVSDDWGKTNKLTATATSLSDENYYAITKEEKQPKTWTKLNNSKNIIIEKDIDSNGEYYLWIKNKSSFNKYINGVLTPVSSEGITHEKFEVKNVDSMKPEIVNEININNKTANSFDVTLEVADRESGISKVIWYYKSSSDSSYNTIVDELNGEIENILLSKEFDNLTSYTNYTVYVEIYDEIGNITKTNKKSITTLPDKNVPFPRYTTHVENIGWQDYVIDGEMAGTSGKSLRLEGIKIKLENQDYDGNIEYRTHIQNIGWESSFKKNDEMSGTEGLSYRLEAIEIKLTGEMAEHYDIYYRVHAQNYGWLGWARNGERSGTAGYAYRLEGIEIKMVPKGEKFDGYGQAAIFYDKTTGELFPVPDDAKVSYTTHVENIGWQNYVQDGRMAGTSGQSLRLEGIKIKLLNPEYEGNIEYRTHIQNIGWEDSFKKNDEMSGTTGLSYRLEAIEIKLTGEISEHYDVYYRVHAENFGWLGWAKNGEQAGTAGYAYRLEGIEIKLVPKGETPVGYGFGPLKFYQK